MAFTDGNTLSAADVAAVTGNSGFGSFGGDGAWLILILAKNANIIIVPKG